MLVDFDSLGRLNAIKIYTVPTVKERSIAKLKTSASFDGCRCGEGWGKYRTSYSFIKDTV